MADKAPAAARKSKIKLKRALCGTPVQYCCGTPTRFSSGMKQGKSHATHMEAFRCHADYMVRVLGYKKIGSRDFEPPDGGPIRVLTKPSRFGAMVRGGKEERYMGNYRFTGGTIISS